MAITPEQAFEMAGEMFSSTEDMEFSPIQEAYFEEIEAAQIVINTAADLQAMHGISISDTDVSLAQAIAHPIPSNLNAQFEEATAADMINSGHYASPYVPLHVSSTTAVDEQGLIEYLASEIQHTIDNYNPQTNAAVTADAVWDATIGNYNPPINMNEQIVEMQHQIAATITAPEYVMAPTFEIASNPTVSLSEIKARRFYIVDGGKYIKPPPEAAWLFDDAENRFKLIDFD